jgi:hypothetical protein
MSSAGRLRCSHCAGIIGAYEPLVVRLGSSDRESSLAAEPELPLAGASHLHPACAAESMPPADVVSLEYWLAAAARRRVS